MSKKRRKERTRSIPVCFVFTPETIRLTQRAIALFEQPLQRANKLDDKVAFAEETVQAVKQKLALMLESVGQLFMTTFDYNEKIILRHSLLMYSIELLEGMPNTPQLRRELRQCRIIAMNFEDKQLAD